MGAARSLRFAFPQDGLVSSMVYEVINEVAIIGRCQIDRG